MKRGIKGTVCITLTSIALMVLPGARGAHAKHYLNDITFEVTNTLATVTNLTKAQKRALSSAAKALNRNTTTLAGDLGAFATAATALNSKSANFDGANGFITVQDPTLDAYYDTAVTEFNSTVALFTTNAMSASLSNQLARARAALTNANSQTNIAKRARALAAASNKLSAAVKKVWKDRTAPDAITSDFDLTETAELVNDQTKFFFDAIYTIPEHPEGYFSFTADNPEEVGLWTYERTGAHTGVVHLNVSYAQPPNSAHNHDLVLTFETPRSGTFTGKNIADEDIKGTFVIY